MQGKSSRLEPGSSVRRTRVGLGAVDAPGLPFRLRGVPQALAGAPWILPTVPGRKKIEPQPDNRSDDSRSDAFTRLARREIRGPKRTLALGVATVAGVGRFPVGPGTMGSAAAVLVAAPWLWGDWGLGSLLVVIAVLAGAGLWASGVAGRILGRADDGRIVIDEVVGQLLALVPLVSLPPARIWPWVVTGFVLFRCLDIWKPGPVGWAERGFVEGVAVMADDVVAGVLAAAILAGLLAVVPMWPTGLAALAPWGSWVGVGAR